LLNRESVGHYYAFDHNHHLVLDRSLVIAYEDSRTFLKQLYQSAKRYSHLLTLLSERLYLLNRQLEDKRVIQAYEDKEKEGDMRKKLDLFSDLNIYRKDLPQPWKEAVEITKEVILLFKRSVEEHGSRFVLIGLSNAEQVHPDLGTEVKRQYDDEFDYEQPDRVLEDLSRENRIVFLKLMPAFREYHLRTGQGLHGFGSARTGHWNETGHRLAAELTFQFLREHQMIPL
jgi:hypothetical protein